MVNPVVAALLAAGVACLAACVGAFANLTAFVGGRETKIAEFRQNWITALRTAVIEFCASSRFVAATLGQHRARAAAAPEPLPELGAEMTEARKALASSYHTVVLLLNLKEKEHAALKVSLQQVQQALKNFTSFADIQVKLELVENAAADVFKREWTVIKSGGVTGQKWLRASGILISVASVLGLGLLALAFLLWRESA